MSRRRAIPGFRTVEGTGTLYAREDVAEALIRAELHHAEAWSCRLRRKGVRGGRGATAVIELDGLSVRIKQMLRGGLIGPLWRDRYFGPGRLFENIRAPLEAADRGVRTPRPVALLALAGPPGLYRGWLAFEEAEGTVDLSLLLDQRGRLDDRQLEVVMARVRQMHDLGVEHRDLNVGNLLIDADGSDGWIIDLDKAKLHHGPLPEALRDRALHRLGRSYRKRTQQRSGAEDMLTFLQRSREAYLSAVR